tara:strand:- start:63 stop:326 length:264 start_codon:yes stop_codon:yes gene_type:complete
MATTNAIFRAVKIINSDAKLSISGNDLDSITWEDGTSAISKSDIEAKLTQAQNELDTAATKKINDKASANAKLKALGLTDDEIEALK